jgi:hypothetical protein
MALTRPSKLISSDISGSFNKSAVSASFAKKGAVSGSLGTNATLIRGLTTGKISGSLGANASLIRSLTGAAISGSIVGGVSGSVASTGSFGSIYIDKNVNASSFVGDGSSLTGIDIPTAAAISGAAAITAIASTAANQILTDDGDATVTSEANLTFDGTNLNIAGTGKLFFNVDDGQEHISGTGADGTLTINGDRIIDIKPGEYYCRIYEGDGNDHKATFGGEIDWSGKMVPVSDNTYDLGKTTKAWKDIIYEGSLTDTSDERFKENIEDCDLGLDFINALQPRKFNKILDREQVVTTRTVDENDADLDIEELVTHEDYDPERKRYGIIAQEVIEVLKSLDKEGKFWGIDESNPDKYHADYISFITPLMKAVQELSAKVEALENA